MNATHWPTKRLRDITSKIGSGATPRGGKESYLSSGISLIRSLNVYDFKFEKADLAFISDEQAADLSNVAVQRDDILLNITGASVARCCLTDPRYLPARVNQHVAIVRVRPEAADARFVLYCINSPHFKSRLLSLAQGGATREALTKTTIEDFEVLQPSLPVQRRIAGMLSAYDDLIENSQRRIKILEEMARRLYREWFVHFRFPGHESCRLVESSLGEIPEGWEVRRLDEVCRSIQDGDWIETKDQGGEDYRLLQISNVGVGEFIETGNFRYVTQETFSRLRCNEIVPGDLLVARMPTPIGRGWLATKMPWRMITAVDVAIIRAEPILLNPLF
jgi:type I restriction enzyme S subunit